VIRKQDILDRAAEWQLRVDVVEKDYVLGWLLAAVASHSETSTNWVFKGGTCLKKCYFETYRFSEDLDFSLTPQALYTAHELRQALLEVALIAHELSGIEFPPDLVAVRERTDKGGRTTFEGKLGYRGPLAAPFHPRILFDLTQHEPILAARASCPVFHPYPDELPAGRQVTAYALDELFAEKLRALVERTRPRDLYDIGFMIENHSGSLNLDLARDLFRGKCRAKDLVPPKSTDIVAAVRANEELVSEWSNMLAHQLPQLPPLPPMLDRLPTLLAWLETPAASPAPVLTALASSTGESVVAPAGGTYWRSSVPIEVIRFAGANRLLIQFSYHHKSRVAEAYSLRRAQNGNLLLYAWERGGTTIKAFKVSEMSGTRATSEPFNPRYSVELTASGPVRVLPTSSGSRFSGHWTGRGRSSTRASRRSRGPVYVFQCPSCGREFRHRTNHPRLRRHQTTFGTSCSGRWGTLIRTQS
jgi:predicted nucleotidyltransferase component of viral defense system